MRSRRLAVAALLAAACLAWTGCGTSSGKPTEGTADPSTASAVVSSPSASPGVNDQDASVAIDDPRSWIALTEPGPNERDVPGTLKTIRITFNQPMDPKTLNAKTITVMEGKESSMLQDLYDYSYDAKSRVLTMTFRNPESSYGTSNGIDVWVGKDVKNATGSSMGVDVHFGFAVKWIAISESPSQEGFSAIFLPYRRRNAWIARRGFPTGSIST